MTYQQCEISSFADIQSRLLRDSIALWHRGEFAAAFQAVLHSVALNADDIQAHTLVFYWIWQSSDADGERLAALWADSYLPTMGVDICEEALIEAVETVTEAEAQADANAGVDALSGQDPA